MRPVLRLELESRILGLGGEISVLHGRIEGVAQRFQPRRRQVRRRDEGAANPLPSIEKFDRLPLFGGAREIKHEWNALEVGVGRGAALKKDRNLLRWDPVRSPDADAVEAFADALDLAAFHRQEYVRGGRKSADQLEFRSDQFVERLWIGAGPGSWTRIAQDQLLVEQVRYGLDTRGVIGDAHIRFLRRRSDPGQPGWIEARAGCAGERPERRVSGNDSEHRAVLRRDVEEIACGRIAARTRHVLRNHGRISWQMPADMPRDGTAPEVVAAARSETDDHLDRLAGNRFASRQRCRGHQQYENRRGQQAWPFRLHAFPALARGTSVSLSWRALTCRN